MPGRSKSEPEMQAKLHLAHVGVRCKCKNLSGIRSVNGSIWQSQVRMVESVEVLPAELDRLSFGNGEDLGQGQVENVLRRPAQ